MSRLKQLTKFLLFLEDNPKHKVVGAHPLMALAIGYSAWILGFLLFEYLLPHGFIALILGILAVPIVLVESLHCLLDR